MIIDGKELARKTREKLKIECDNLKKEYADTLDYETTKAWYNGYLPWWWS